MLAANKINQEIRDNNEKEDIVEEKERKTDSKKFKE